MFIEMVKTGSWPSTVLPWCQQNFVYRPVNDWILEHLSPEITVVMGGGRGDQVKRTSKKSKTYTPTDRMDDYSFYQPGFDVHRDTVKSILKKAGVPLWWGYEMGAARTSCWMCPGMNGDQALFIQENFPGLARFIGYMEKHMGVELDRNRGKAFCELVDVGKRNAAKRARTD